MPTEAGKTAARQHVWTAMTSRNWTNGDLASNSRTDPATIGDFLAGRRWPRPATLGKIEDALGLTPGTLAALGEEAPFRLGQSPLGGDDVLGPDLSDIGDAELAAELTYRLESMRRELDGLWRRLFDSTSAIEREERMAPLREEFLGTIDEDSDHYLQRVASQWVELQFKASGEGGGWGSEESRHYEWRSRPWCSSSVWGGPGTASAVLLT